MGLLGVAQNYCQVHAIYSKAPEGKAPKGSVQVITSHGRLQLRFRLAGERHYISVGHPDSLEGRKLAEMKAKEIGLDMISGNFDQTLANYKPQSSLKVASPDMTPKATPKLSELWQLYVDAMGARSNISCMQSSGADSSALA